VQENLLKDWRQIQAAAGRTEWHSVPQGGIDVRLRQIVVPELGVTDRCVSCHVAMAPGEEIAGWDGVPLRPTVPAVLAPHPPIPHDPAEFGCTVCHGGQGRATEEADAHGYVHHWPEPLIPMRYATAGCGTCHTHLRVPDLARLGEGRMLVERYDCLACHRIEGRGGTIRPGGAGGMEGPDLSQVGSAGIDPGWYESHLAQWQASEEGPWAAAFGPVEPQDRDAIERFLQSLVGAPELVRAKALFHSVGCRGCHKVRGIGGDDGPDLTLIGERNPHQLDFTHVEGEHTLANWLSAHTRNPAKIVPGSKMPAMGLSDQRIDRLTLYMLSLRSTDFPEAYWPQDRVRAERFGEREFSTDGATLYGTFCAACHGPSGEGLRYPDTVPFPAVANPDFLAVADDELIAEMIRRGRPGRRMPAWDEAEGGLRSREIARLVTHLRTLAGVAEPDVEPRGHRWVEADPQRGAALFATHCAGCHGADGKSEEAPALNNRVLLDAAGDTYLVETIARGRRGTRMPGFRAGSPAHPALAPEDIEAVVVFIRTWETTK